jgi:putative PIN family toxin of toxin-antitoxin system
MRVVFDTKVLISVLIFGGKPEVTLQVAMAKGVTLVVSAEILLELEGVLVEKFGWTPERASTVRRRIREAAELVVPRLVITACEDPDDNRILEAAKEGPADVIVSGDKHLLRMKVFEGIEILTVGEFLMRMSGGRCTRRGFSARGVLSGWRRRWMSRVGRSRSTWRTARCVASRMC